MKWKEESSDVALRILLQLSYFKSHMKYGQGRLAAILVVSILVVSFFFFAFATAHLQYYFVIACWQYSTCSLFIIHCSLAAVLPAFSKSMMVAGNSLAVVLLAFSRSTTLACRSVLNSDLEPGILDCCLFVFVVFVVVVKSAVASRNGIILCELRDRQNGTW